MSDLLDPIIVEWLREGPETGPEHGLERALAATRPISQRPGWTFPRWWLAAPMANGRMRPTRRVGLVVLVALMTIAASLALATTFGGALHRTNPLGEQGHAIAYQDGPSVYAAWPDGSHRVRLSADVPFARLPVFSPDGQRLAFVAPLSADARSGRLMVVSVDSPGPAIDVSHGIEVVASDVPQVSWSPDSRRIAFSGLADGVATIFVASSDGGAAPRAISDASIDRDLPTWAPDGEWIGFRERDPDGLHVRLRMTHPDGTEGQDVNQVVAQDAFLSKLRWLTDPDGGVGEPGSTRPVSYWWAPGFGSDASAYIDLRFGYKIQPWAGARGGFADFGLPWSPEGDRVVLLTQSQGVIVADRVGRLLDHLDRYSDAYHGHVRSLGPVAACWVDWSPDGTSLYGGSPDGCDGVVVIPLSNPGAAIHIPGSTAGVASWQPQARTGPSR
jgi:WD40 repeat protein